MTSLAEVTFCVLDLETTGCEAGVDAITEIGAITVRGGQVLGTYSTLVHARQPVPTFIALLTGISDSMLADAPPIEQVLPSLVEFLRGTVLVGHNVRFDARFLDAALTRHGYMPLDCPIVDTLPLARTLLRDDSPNCRLTTLAAALSLGTTPTHRAFADACATADLLHVLIERGTGWGTFTLDDLTQLPKLGAHPHARKLPMTNRLPRARGVYLFHGAGDRVIHIGRADDIRRTVRAYFASRDRRRIAPLLRETQRISAIEIDDPLVADVVETRLRQLHQPRWDRHGAPPASASRYVHVDPRARRPVFAVAQRPRPRGLHLGPLPTRRMAEIVRDALASVDLEAGIAALRGDPRDALDALRDSPDRGAAVRATALAAAVARTCDFTRVRALGARTVECADRPLTLDHGLLVGADRPLPVAPLHAVDWHDPERPLPAWAAPEVLRVARHLTRTS